MMGGPLAAPYVMGDQAPVAEAPSRCQAPVLAQRTPAQRAQRGLMVADAGKRGGAQDSERECVQVTAVDNTAH